MSDARILRMSPTIDQLAIALCEFQYEVHLPDRNKEGSIDGAKAKFDFSYATFDAMWNSTKELRKKHGLAISQLGSGPSIVLTILMHAPSGQFIVGETPVKPRADGMQSYNGALASARRVAFAGALGLVTKDKEEGGGHTPKASKRSGAADPMAFIESIRDAKDFNEHMKASALARKTFANSAEDLGKIDDAIAGWFVSLLDACGDEDSVPLFEDARKRTANAALKEPGASRVRDAIARGIERLAIR